MTEFTFDEKLILIQYSIKKYDIEEILIEKLKGLFQEKDIQRCIDTLIGTQKVRRIGTDVLENNESHTELPELPEHLKSIIEKI